MKQLTRKQKTIRRHARVRAKVSGTAVRPRLHVSRGLMHIYAQLIDDVSGKTIASAHSKTVTIVPAPDRSGKVATAYVVGKTIAEKAATLGITTVVFDRGGFQYIGRVKAVADGARDAGLVF